MGTTNFDAIQATSIAAALTSYPAAARTATAVSKTPTTAANAGNQRPGEGLTVPVWHRFPARRQWGRVAGGLPESSHNCYRAGG